MNVRQLKREIRNKLTKQIIFVGASFIFMIFCIFVNSSSQTKFNKVNLEKNTVESEFRKKSELFLSASDGLGDFEKIPENKRSFGQDLSNNQLRIKTALPVIEELKKIYKFKTFEVSLGNAEEEKNQKFEKFKISKSTINIKLDAPSDEFIHSFINDLSAMLAGYISIENLRIEKKSEINEDAIEKYLKDPKFSIVSADISLAWRTLNSNEVKK
jgi:hypothetical protein